jgi:hypothetical protein
MSSPSKLSDLLHVVLVLCALMLMTATTGCERKTAEKVGIASPLPTAQIIDPRVATAPVPTEEPSEEALRTLEFKRYEEIELAGGLPVTITATGRSLTLHPKLYEVRKQSCKPTPQAPPGWYECSLTIKLSLKPDGSNPSEQGERIGVKWDTRGMWVLQ